MRFQRLVAETVAAVTGLALFAGCTSSSEPKPLPEPTRSSAASPSPSPSPTATPPTLPPEAAGTSPAAAKAFARYYIDLVSYAMVSGDTSQLRAASADECTSCDAIAGNIDEIYASGGHIESDGWRIETIQVLGDAGDSTVLSLGLFLEREAVVARDGETETHEGHEQPMTMRLVHPGDFRVKELELVS